MPTVRICANSTCPRFGQATEYNWCTACGQPTEFHDHPANHTSQNPPAATAVAPNVPASVDSATTANGQTSRQEPPRQRGWYQRPGDPAGVQRWYDGTRWTDQLTGGDSVAQTQAPRLTAGPPPAAAGQWQWRLPAFSSEHAGTSAAGLAPFRQGIAGAPPEVLVVCALMSLAGILLLWPALQVLPTAFEELGNGALGRAVGLIALDLALIVLALGVGLLILAWRLTQADRVARGLSYILLGGYSFAVLIGNDHSAGLVITMLLCLAAIGVLAAAPSVREYFNRAPSTGPVSVTIVRTLFAAFACMMLLFGISYLPAGALGGQYVVAGLFLLGIGAAMFGLNRGLAAGSPGARIVATVLMAVYALLVLIAGGRATATLVGLGFAAAAIGMLWIPQDAQRHFVP